MNRTLCLLVLPGLALSLAAQSAPAKPKAAVAAPKAEAKPTPKPAAKAEAKPEVKPLTIGDPAPAFKVARWVKGSPVAALEKGKVYVVEFWATWCGPCRETIPHLTEMAKKRQGKATFLGVDVWERGADAAAVDKKVDEFVAQMGDKMDYAVCRDGQDQHMANAWMKAANQNSIPAAFIVDKEGRIAHVGHPMEKEFEQALDQVIAGTWDMKAAQAKAAQAAEEEKAEKAKVAARAAAWKDVAPGLAEAQKAKDWAKVLTLADQAEAKHPDLKANLKRPRFVALAHTDAAKAQALVEADLAKPDLNAYMGTATMLLGESGLDRRWSEQALKCIDKAVELEPKIAPRVASYRFRALLRSDLPKAKEMFDAEKAKGAAKAANLASLAVAEDGVDKPMIESATTVLEEALKAPDAPPFLRQGLAEGYFKLGRSKDAAAAQETFLEWAKKEGAPAPFLTAGEEKLKAYKAAVK